MSRDAPTPEIAALDAELRVLRECRSGTDSSTIDLRIAQNRMKRNSYLRAHLPPELLVEVLDCAMEDTPLSGYYARLSDLATVCRRWYDLVHSAPSLWNKIHPSLSLKQIRMVLDKSKDVPLRISYRTRYREEPTEGKFMAVCEQLLRWGEVFLSLDDAELSRGILEQPAPELVKLELSSTSPPEDINLFGGDAPKLRHLKLRHVLIPLGAESTVPILSRLEFFELQTIMTDAPNSTRLLSALCSCSVIQTIVIDRVLGAPSPGQLSIELPKLHTLFLFNLSADYSAALLSSIVAPQCRYFRLERVSPLPAHFFKTAISPFLRHLSGKLQAKEVAFQLSNKYFILHHYLPNSVLESRLQFAYSANAMDAFEWAVDTFIATLNTPGVKVELSIDDGWNAFEQDRFFPTLDRLQYVSKMNIGEGREDLSLLFEHLSRAVPGEDDRRVWRLPNLAEVVIYSASRGWSGLLTMLISRYGLEEYDPDDLPPRFEKCGLGLSHDDALWERVKGIVGSDVLYEPRPPWHIERDNLA